MGTRDNAGFQIFGDKEDFSFSLGSSDLEAMMAVDVLLVVVYCSK